MLEIYKDRSRTIGDRVRDLMGTMTIEEKVGQMVQISFNSTSIEEAEEWVSMKCVGSFLHVLGDDARHLQRLAMDTRLGIPMIFGIDAVHGHSLKNGATLFPSQLSMACSWNPELIEEAGRVTAREVAADGLHWTFSPILCLGRDLRWGRINETFGEDPYLTGVLAASIIQGYQGKDLSDHDSILACAKHYIAYGESTGGRDAYDTQISSRKVREVFLPPFKMAVEAGCATFMSAYQSIDGTPVTSNRKMLRSILKEELNFEGFVVTDWDNTASLVRNQMASADMDAAVKKAVESGNDMIMYTKEFYESAIKLVKEGSLSESFIDDAVGRILTVKFKMGLFDGRADAAADRSIYSIGCPEHLDTNLELTRESIVLLENRQNTLPLRNDIKRLAVIGPNADDIQAQFGDWTFLSHPDPKPGVVPKLQVHTVLNGIRELAGKRSIEVVYHKGCDILDAKDQDISGAVECAASSDAIIAVVGDCLAQNGEFKDRADLNLSGSQQKLLEELKACGRPLIVVLVNGKPLSIPWLMQNADALLETFNSGLFGGKAVAEVIFGEINPSGRLPISFPYHSGQLPVYYNQLPGWPGGKYVDMPENPLYSFGYGLSFTHFEYSNLKLSSTSCTASDTIIASVDVTNTGEMDGSEVVQLYVRDIVSSVVTPIKQLKGFAKVKIKAGETRTIDIPVRICELCIVNENEEYIVEPGEFEIMVGPDSREESLLKATIISTDSAESVV